MSSPVKSCSLDPVPTFIVRECVDLLLPYITCMVNASLSQGRLPDLQKHAIVVPLLKKSGLDTADMANFRPVSNLTFMSKVVERVVAEQLNEHLAAHGLLPRHQSAYRKQHSTEMAMLRVLSDALTAADARRVTLIGLLDLTAAFDCVDHSLLLRRLQHNFGVTDEVFRWKTSFVTGRTQQVAYDDRLSPTRPVCFGVPQGSVLGPLLFVLYTAGLSQLVASHGLDLHQYADDCQVYASTPVDDVTAAVDRFARCLVDVGSWMTASRLRLNPSKTQVMWLGSKHQLDRITVRDVPVLSSSIRVADAARDLGVVVDSRLTMGEHVTALCRAAFCQLRQLRPVARSLSVDAAKILVQAFITCRLDYCNSLLYGISDSLFRRLQSVQNAAARLVTGARRRDHITPVLRELHWLPVRRRVDYKLAVLAFKSLQGSTPPYLADDCLLVTEAGRRQLRSADVRTCVVPRTRTQLGDRSFSVAGPRVWNSLPSALRRSDLEFGQFRRLLKTFLFV
jgi:hypothetical protein